MPDVNAANNPLLKPYREGLPDFAKATERDSYFGLGKALLEFESEVVSFETRCECKAASTFPIWVFDILLLIPLIHFRSNSNHF